MASSSQPRRAASSRAAATRATEANRLIVERERDRFASSRRWPAPQQQAEQRVQPQAQRQVQRQVQRHAEEVAPQQGSRARGKRPKTEEPGDEWQAPVISKSTWDDIMRCVVCGEINLAPVVLCANSHTGLCCSECVRRMKDLQRDDRPLKCPTCRTTVELTRPAPRAHVAMMETLFSTQSCEKGCGARLTLDGLRSHVEVCPNRSIQCPMCSLKVKARDFIHHQLNQATHPNLTRSSVTHADADSLHQFDFQLESEQSMKELGNRESAYQIIEGVMGNAESFLSMSARIDEEHGSDAARDFKVKWERELREGQLEFATTYLDKGSFIHPGYSDANLCRMWAMLHPIYEEHMVLISGNTRDATQAADQAIYVTDYSARVALFIAPVSTSVSIRSNENLHVAETLWVDFMGIEGRQTNPVWLTVTVNERFPDAASATWGERSCLTKTFRIRGTQKREIHPILDTSCPDPRSTSYIRTANLSVRCRLHIGSLPA